METKLIARSVDGSATINRETEGKTILEFYPVVFNQRSKLIREYGETFFEVIAPEALTKVLANPELNVLATVDHNRSKMLGRNKSNTLKLSTDERGLKATIEMPHTTLGNDMSVMIERGDYFECSFIYTIAENGVQYDRSGATPIRTVTNIADLYDVSIVIDGAFANTEILKRSQEMQIEAAPISEIEATAAELVEARAIENTINILEKELEIINLIK